MAKGEGEFTAYYNFWGVIFIMFFMAWIVGTIMEIIK